MNKQTLKAIIFTGLFLVPFIPFLVSGSFFFPFITTKAFAWRIIVEIIFAAWVILALLYEEYRPRKSLVLYALAVFILVVGIADIFGVAPSASFWSNFERMEGFVSLLHFGAFFVVITSVFKEIDWVRWWKTSLAASFIMVLHSFFQVVGSLAPSQGGVRVDGTFGNATYLAVYILFHIFIALLFIWREWKSVSARWVYGLLILSQLFVLYHTATRGAIIGLLGGLLIVALLNVRNKESAFARKSSVTLLLSLMVLVGGFFALKNTSFVNENPVLSRFSSLTLEDIKTQGRFYVWPMAIKGFEERPILGWGQENFIYVFQKYYVPEMYQLEPWFDRAHNIFLDWLVAGGILGLFSYLALYFTSLYLIWRKDGGLSHAERSLLTGLLAAYFFHNFFVFDHLVSYILFFSLLGYIHCRNSDVSVWDKSFNEASVRVFAVPITVIALVSTFYFVNVRPITANIYIIESLKAVQLADYSSAASNFKKAYQSSEMGKPEVVMQMTTNLSPIIASNIFIEEKRDYFVFAAQSAENITEEFPLSGRYHLITSSLLSSTGYFNEALVHLEKARELMPNKQDVYFELTGTYLGLGDRQAAIETLTYLGELSPPHKAQADEYIRQIRNGEI